MLSMLVILIAAVSIARASLYSGAEEVGFAVNKVFIPFHARNFRAKNQPNHILFQVCSLSECDCVGETVTCTCEEDSSFQVKPVLQSLIDSTLSDARVSGPATICYFSINFREEPIEDVFPPRIK